MVKGGNFTSAIQLRVVKNLQIMKTIFKANGITFNSMSEVENYTESNNLQLADLETFVYKNTKIVAINLEAKRRSYLNTSLCAPYLSINQPV